MNLPRECFIERHDEVSILFADICNFTPLTQSLVVDKLVETLNDLFGKFDAAAEVEKTVTKFSKIKNVFLPEKKMHAD